MRGRLLLLSTLAGACGARIQRDAGADADAGCIDEDADGYPAAACGGSDCDDLDPDVHPGALDGWQIETVADEAADDLSIALAPAGEPVVAFDQGGPLEDPAWVTWVARLRSDRWDLERAAEGAIGWGGGIQIDSAATERILLGLPDLAFRRRLDPHPATI